MLREHSLADPSRHFLLQRPCAGSKGAPPGRPGYGSTVWLAPEGTVWRDGPATAARGRCQGGLATAAPSGQHRQAPSSTAAPHRQPDGATMAARVQQHSPTGPSRRHVAQQPRTGTEGALPGWLGFSSTFWPAPANTVQRVSLAPMTRVHGQGSTATAAQSGWPRQVPSSAVAPCHWRGGTAGVARPQQHNLAGTSRHHPERQPLASTEGVLPGWPGYGGTVWPAWAGTIQSSSPAPVAKGGFQGSPAMAARPGWPWQGTFSASNPCWLRQGAARVARLQQHGLARPGRRRLLRRPRAGIEEALPGWHH